MRLKIVFGIVAAITCFFGSFPTFSLEIGQKIEIIERTNFQKKMSVKNLTQGKNGQLKHYRTFSLKLSGKLIFCHISNDGSEPRVICH